MENKRVVSQPQSGAGKVYVREASGMVRELGPIATLAVSSSIVAIGTASNLMQVWQPFLFPGSDVPTGLTLALIPAIFFGIMYVLFSMNMPRSGGDYVYVSRIIHPVIGYIMNFVFTFWMIIWWGSNFAVVVYAMISPAVGGYALATNNSGLLSWASSIGTTPNDVFIGGIIALIIVAVFVTLGPKYTGRYLVTGFIIGLIGQITLMLLFAGASTSSFSSSFNSHFAGVANFTGIEKVATANGWSYAPLTFAASAAALPYAFLWYLGYNMSAYVAGEVKKVQSSMFVAILGSLILGWAVYIITNYLYLNVVPYQFQESIAYLFTASPTAYPLPIFPGPYFFVGLLTSNPVIAFLPMIGMVFWAFLLPVAVAMVVTRNIFAWSFDRVVPRFLSDLNPRTHSPIKTTLLMCVIGVIFLWLWAYTSYMTQYINFIFALALAYIIPGIAAIVYPYLRKDQYRNTPAAKYKIGGLPLIVLCGVISTIFYIYISYECYVTPVISGPTGVVSIALIIGTFVAAPIIYYAAKYYHMRKEGIDISSAFKEIPPG
jgi:APA family basic amino acid/polyamine antiporter